MDFYSNFVRLCAEKNISPTAAAEAAGINRATVTRWKQGTAPSYLMIMKVANYFHVDPRGLTFDDVTTQMGMEKETLTTCDERELLNAWRKADDYTKATIGYALRQYGFKMIMLEQGKQQKEQRDE